MVSQQELTDNHADVVAASRNCTRSIGECAVPQVTYVSRDGESEDVAVGGAGVAQGGAVVQGLNVVHLGVHHGPPGLRGDRPLQRVLRVDR